VDSETNQPDGSRQKDNSSESKAVEQKRRDYLAGKTAERAEKTEQRYDQDHNISTK
jgi:hypothetical protein